MKLCKVSLNGFRGIRSLELSLLAPNGLPLDLIVLAGSNGCGKTAVMEACIWGLNRDHLLPSSHRVDKKDINNDCGKLEVLLQGIDAGGRQWETLRSIPAPESNLGRAGQPANFDLLSHHVVAQLGKMYPVQYFSSWRYPSLVGSVPITAGAKGTETIADAEGQRLAELKRFLVNLSARRAFGDDASLAREKDVYERLNAAWKDFYPERDESFLARPASKEVTEGFDLFVHGRGKNLLPVDQLSAGEIEILTMLGFFILSRLEDGILFLDEPELHLHPAWHRCILPVLRRLLPKTQIVCATHSVEILDSVYSFERFNLPGMAAPISSFDNGQEGGND